MERKDKVKIIAKLTTKAAYSSIIMMLILLAPSIIFAWTVRIHYGLEVNIPVYKAITGLMLGIFWGMFATMEILPRIPDKIMPLNKPKEKFGYQKRGNN